MNRSTQWSVVVGRAMLSAPFITGAWGALKDPGPLPEIARKAGVPQPELMTKGAAGAMLVGALAMGSGAAPVLGAVVLGTSLVGATATVHDFWSEQEAPTKIAHRRAFFTNVGLLGALLAITGPASRARRAQLSGSPDLPVKAKF